jgi:hypothetical protein
MHNPNAAFLKHPSVFKAISRETQRVMAADGVEAFVASKRLTAYHEAGHVLACELNETPATGATIRKQSNPFGFETWTGVASGAPAWVSDETSDPFADFKVAIHLMAGYLAEQFFCPEECGAGSSLDERAQATALVNRVALKLGVRASIVGAAVVGLLYENFEAHADAMHTAATILMRNGRLSERQCDRIFELALPGAWAVAFYEADPEAAELELGQARREIADLKRRTRQVNRTLKPTIRQLEAADVQLDAQGQAIAQWFAPVLAKLETTALHRPQPEKCAPVHRRTSVT